MWDNVKYQVKEILNCLQGAKIYSNGHTSLRASNAIILPIDHDSLIA